jgi:hypothetical protein
VPVWWFDGDRAAARKAFIHRSPESVETLNTQMMALDQYWRHIEPIIQESTIMTVSADGTYLRPEVIFGRMFGGLDDSA